MGYRYCLLNVVVGLACYSHTLGAAEVLNSAPMTQPSLAMAAPRVDTGHDLKMPGWIDIDFVDVPIRDLLKTVVTDVGHYQLKFHPAVKGEMSVKVKATWYEIFLIVLNKNRLAYRKYDRVLYVAPVDIINKSRGLLPGNKNS